MEVHSEKVRLFVRKSAYLLAFALAFVVIVPSESARAQSASHNPPLSWTTLATQAGPLPSAERSDPANLLVVNGKPWLVDCGDGAME
jgi:hypothetical protein